MFMDVRTAEEVEADTIGEAQADEWWAEVCRAWWAAVTWTRRHTDVGACLTLATAWANLDEADWLLSK